MSNKTNLKYKQNKPINFEIEYIDTIAKMYKLEVKEINKEVIEITNPRKMSTWFAYLRDDNNGKYIELRHKNQGSENMHSHHQKDFYDIEFLLKSVSSHDIYKIVKSDYRNSRMGRLFCALESGQSKYVKLC